MNARKVAVLVAAAALALAGSARGAARNGFSLDVLLDGRARPEYFARGAVYVEAVRGRPYVLRITNPLPCWVGVALAVDGLNTLDARHTDARAAAKWLLGPYQTVEIPGWQVSGSDARRFTFTGERSSYGAWLGQTADLGVIEAVFYRRKAEVIKVAPQPVAPSEPGTRYEESRPSPPASGAPRANGGGIAGGVPGGVVDEAPAPSAGSSHAAPAPQRKLSDEFAATGIGERTRHDVEWVDMDLEDAPAAVVRIRYEFRDRLVRMGILSPDLDPFARRERARGFAGGYCPEP